MALSKQEEDVMQKHYEWIKWVVNEVLNADILEGYCCP
jgi:O-glycosyl hydrolase